MSLSTWLAFAGASIILLLIPGPTILLVLGDSLANRERSSWSTVAGVAAGDATAMSVSLAGAGALLAASAAAFTLLKLCGGAYLIYLGARALVHARRQGAVPLTTQPRPARQRFTSAWAVTALNPKSITFFVAFLPQFLDRHTDFWTQMAIFEATFLTLAFANAFGYALIASRAREMFRSRRVITIFNRTGGTLLVGAGIATVATRSG